MERTKLWPTGPTLARQLQPNLLLLGTDQLRFVREALFMFTESYNNQRKACKFVLRLAVVVLASRLLLFMGG